ncbi:MAG: phosphopyruvate hydratase [Chlamydiota bacterium]|jgi:enolase
MEKLEKVHAIEILDSRGNPTIRVFVQSTSGLTACASVPSGASTGEHEALELRDHEPSRYFGKGVLKAVENVNGPLQKALLGKDPVQQEEIDQLMLSVDGTENKSKMGANAILGISLANAKLKSLIEKKPLFASIREQKKYILPMPMMNIINGGAHADNMLDFQEFMIRPIGAANFQEAIRWGAEIFHTLKKLLQNKGYATSVGDEGGFAPPLGSNEEALEFIVKAIENAGYKPFDQVTIALDPAASEFFEAKSKQYIETKKQKKNKEFKSRSIEEMVSYYSSLCEEYPIDSIEDGLDQNDWQGWKLITEKLGNDIQLVGDDLFVTNPKFLQKGIEQKIANSILIKVNQIGTLTETLQTIDLAHQNNYTTVISHRSGETEDTFIADLAVAVNAGQIKTGSLSRSDRIAKYNRLLEIEDMLGKEAILQDSNPKKNLS